MPLDLRSDTVTRPTPGMRAAMAGADVGDDVYGEDPTVNALQGEFAALFGHEAALFVPSGTMGNQLGARLLVAPGEEVLCESEAHLVSYEGGAAARYGGVSTRTLAGERGRLDPEAVRAALRLPGYGAGPTRAVAVERTHNRGGGAAYPLEQLRALHAVVAGYGVALHCDGARIWNAAVATGVPLSAYGGLFDTLSVCLSKGLGAPVGSLLVSTAERIERARALRRGLGGSMRQAGVLAAAGRYALLHHIDRLALDHARAQRLAGALTPYAEPAHVQTNVVLLELVVAPMDAPTLAARAAAEGVLIGVVGPTRTRLVTHLDVDDAGVERAIRVLCQLLRC